MRSFYIGENKLINNTQKVSGEFVEIENEKFYKISNSQEMDEFLMSVVSDSDHFMFISSNGSLSAGRKNKDNALFPYYTDDKIHDYRNITGSKTYVLVSKGNRTSLWEPFTVEAERSYQIQRNIYKSIYGNKLIFEEINEDLGVSFQYGWYNSDRYGWIKKSSCKNLSEEAVEIDILDGIRNILPYGVDYPFQNEYSNLLNAYKKCERIDGSSLGIFALSSIPVDRPEPSEALKTTTVWSLGSDSCSKILISDKQVDRFLKGETLESELDIRAARGAYYINCAFTLNTNDVKEWMLAAEINQDSSQVADLLTLLRSDKDLLKLVEDDINLGTKNLIEIVAKADGLQMSNEELCYARHFSNSLFNIMRGGIFTNNYVVEKEDFKLFVQQTNTSEYAKNEDWLNDLAQEILYHDLVSLAEKTNDPDLLRICIEYFPITFSRRHGDPSRPWNYFSIENKNPDGTKKLHYEGNWRDIFQNWEALALSYPDFVEGMITKFVNASTVDGYNPYRITREGIDWEAPDPNDPWAFIGYWGDHQIIYLLKFLEQSVAFHPGKLDDMLTKELFVYANVPYRIKEYEEIVKNPKDTILYDHELGKELEELSSSLGADGKLLRNSKGEICRTNLTEKILVTLLSKLSNFVPEAGIWLNTQRPEWNDANNALVGSGVSMVTLYYIRRFIHFWQTELSGSEHKSIAVSQEVSMLLKNIKDLLGMNRDLLQKGFSDQERNELTASLGRAGSEYRESVYKASFSRKKEEISVADLRDFLGLALEYMDQSIEANKREDDLYHAYNLISFKDSGISIRHLYEMLEGQVSVLSSGYLTPEESLKVMDALKTSKLFREDQFSYILYPDRQLPRFVEKNNIPSQRIKGSELLSKLAADQDQSIISPDENNNYHFNGKFRNADVLKESLEKLDSDQYGVLLEKEKDEILGIYEDLFDHQSFTGRSGTFYGYEGLGSIYWHMVSKLLLAVEECYFMGKEEGADPVTLGRIKDHYYEIKAGIGLYKSPDLYGAFPTDAYSHTPANAGVKQPGLTGQVKEDVISRFAELGIHIRKGEITFDPSLFNNDELLTKAVSFKYQDLHGKEKSIELKAQQLGFTFCQVPFIYTSGKEERITVHLANGEKKVFSGKVITADISSEIFKRSGKVEKVEYTIPE